MRRPLFAALTVLVFAADAQARRREHRPQPRSRTERLMDGLRVEM